MLLTTSYYRDLTGDTASPDAAVASAASAAQDLLEADLARSGYLESEERSEVCLLYPDGTLYPTATPITAIDGGYTVVDDTVYGAVPDVVEFTGLIDTTREPKRATITYTGGYTTATCPEPVLQDLAWATYAILNGTSSKTSAATSATAGASSVRLGDVAITWPAGALPSNPSRLGLAWSEATWRLRNREP